MKVVILGANGMLGHDVLACCAGHGVEVAGYDLPEVDITADGGLDGLSTCDWVINCAAYTNVDGAESARDAAFAANSDGAKRVAQWCRKNDASLLHISTDYVFDGTGTVPYREDDEVNPLSVYGESKLAGERAVREIDIRHFILRTQSLFGRNGRNFVQAIMDRIARGDRELDVVNDQTSCPTYTVHLADAILRLLNVEEQGIVHVAAGGSCTWFELARAIVTETGSDAVVKPVTSDQFARPAKRPAQSVLDTARYELWTGQRTPAWEEGLAEYLRSDDPTSLCELRRTR